VTEPVMFETLRAAPRLQRLRILRYSTHTPFSQRPLRCARCRSAGPGVRRPSFQVPGMDLVVAQACLHHQAELVTFDGHYERIAQVSPLKVRLLKRAG